MGRLSEGQRLEAVARKQAGESYSAISRRMGVSRQAIITLIKKHRVSGSVKDKRGRGRKRATTVRQDRKLIRKSLQNRRLTARQLGVDLAADGTLVCTQTVRNRLREAGLRGCVAAKKPLLSKANKKARLEFARAHSAWSAEDWQRVLWSDESSFELFNTHRRVYVRRREGERFKEECLVPTVKFGGGKIMVWGCFGGGRLGHLVKVTGTMDQRSYKTTLENHMLPSGLLIYGNQQYIFQQDNAPCHKARSVTEFLHQHGVRVMEWPAQSPDLNPIENLWQQMKVTVGKHSPRSMDELFENIEAAWASISNDTLEKLINSMPNRIRQVIQAGGGFTRY